MRLPQVSSSVAVVTGPIATGGWVNRTPASRSRSYSARTSSTANDVNGMPSRTRVSIGLQHQLRPVCRLGRHYGQPTHVAHGEVGFLDESEFRRVERQGFVLV